MSSRREAQDEATKKLRPREIVKQLRASFHPLASSLQLSREMCIMMLYLLAATTLGARVIYESRVCHTTPIRGPNRSFAQRLGFACDLPCDQLSHWAV